MSSAHLSVVWGQSAGQAEGQILILLEARREVGGADLSRLE